MNYAAPRQGIPLRPDERALAKAASRSLARAAVAAGRAIFEPIGNDPVRIVSRMWPDDYIAGQIVKAVTSPASTGTTTALLSTVVADVLRGLGPSSAAAALLSRALQLNFDSAFQINVPALIADAANGSFVGEGQPIPVRQLVIGPPTSLTPHKVATMWSMTREMVESSNAAVLVEDCMRRSFGLVLDKYLFDNVAGDTVRPPGLRYGIAALTASNNPDFFEAMLQDVAKLLNAVAPIGGDVVLVASPARARMTQARARGGVLPLIFGSTAIAPADLIAVAVDGLASAADGEPQLAASREAVVHEETGPAAIVSSGVSASPVRSLYKTDSVSYRLLLDVTWAVRDTRAVAWLTTTW